MAPLLRRCRLPSPPSLPPPPFVLLPLNFSHHPSDSPMAPLLYRCRSPSPPSLLTLLFTPPLLTCCPPSLSNDTYIAPLSFSAAVIASSAALCAAAIGLALPLRRPAIALLPLKLRLCCRCRCHCRCLYRFTLAGAAFCRRHCRFSSRSTAHARSVTAAHYCHIHSCRWPTATAAVASLPPPNTQVQPL